MKRQLQLLTTPGFIAGLLLLLANDFLFKHLFHNWLTGKLSDFAGLFIFPLFWIALAPRRKVVIIFLTAAGFVFWKSAFSQPLIDAWNSLSLWHVRRAVDPTDLLALAVLPLSFFYATRVEHTLLSNPAAQRLALRRLAAYSMLCVSVFAFTATQRADAQRFDYNKQYYSSLSRGDVALRLNNIGLELVDHIRRTETANQPFRPTDYYTLRTKSRYCNGPVNAFVQVTEREQGSFLELWSINYYCDKPDAAHKDKLLAIFEREVIDKLSPQENATGENRRE